MARKRIKTLANDWNVSLDDVLASCERLKLAHAHAESSLVTPEEAERIKSDLEERAQRDALMRREKVVETSAGTAVEKRLTATVMRRRHTETPAPTSPEATPAAEEAKPFHFEAQEPVEEPFVAPIFEEAPEPQIETPALLEPEEQEPVVVPPEVEVAETPPPPAAEEIVFEAEREAAPEPEQVEQIEQVVSPVPAPPEAIVPEPKPEPRPTEAARPRERVEVAAKGQPRREQKPPFAPKPSAEREARETIDLTRGAHASAPSLDDGQRGPKVLGKIDLKAKPPPPRPATPAARPARPAQPSRPGPQRPGQGPRFGAPSAPPTEQMPPPGMGTTKPGARPGIKKKKVVKKDSGDFLAEREMRGLRVPKKRRAMPGKEQRKTEITTPKASKRVVRITEGVTVGDLGRSMGVKAGDLIKKLMQLGQMATVNQVLDVDTASLLAGEFDYTVENVAFDVEQAIEEEAEVQGEAVPRPPVVTVMGHVDHGKTSLLDAIRHTSVTDKEYGGITQHIGAYTVEANGRAVTFVDTPGHEAFTAMRARGAKVTDIVVLVVAANESVMPQTVEAVNHARAANVPIIVAINKIDLPDANIERVKQRLVEVNLIPEEYGGDTIIVPVSARTGEGIDKLLEMILLQAELMELKANPARGARGAVIEAQLDRGRGPVATVLIQEGTLRQGDPFVCGISYGRIRAMLNHLGQRVTEAGPSTPVEIFGLSDVPEPGTQFVAVAEESRARQVAEHRRSKRREGELQKTSRVSLEDLSQRMRAGEIKELKVIIKGDVQGSVEALQEALERLSTDEVKLVVLHGSAGAISETDVSLASASKAIIVGFNVRPEPKATQLAEKEGVEIRLYTIIYEAIDDIREAMEGLLAPTYREKALGRAEVRKTFAVPGGTIAGSMVQDGKVSRGGLARLVRDGRVVYEGKIGSLKRFKDDAREVQSGYECGIGLENFNDIKPGDIVETYELEAVLRKLEPAKAAAVRGQASVEKQLQT